MRSNEENIMVLIFLELNAYSLLAWREQGEKNMGGYREGGREKEREGEREGEREIGEQRDRG